MTRTDIYARIKAVLAELLTPSDLSLVISGVEAPLEQYLDTLCPMVVDDFYQAIPSRIISPVSAKSKVVPEFSALLILRSSLDYISTNSKVVFLTLELGAVLNLNSTNIAQSLDEDVEENDVVLLTEALSYGAKDYVGGYYVYSNSKLYYISNVLWNGGEYIALLSDDIKTYCFGFNKDEKQVVVENYYEDFAINGNELMLPYSLIEIEQMKYSSWVNNPKVIKIDDPAYTKQQNIYTRATYSKPVVALKKNNGTITQVEGITIDSRLYVAEVYSAKDEEDSLIQCDIIIKTPFISLPDDLVPAYSYLVASRYLSSIGNPKADVALKIFTEIVSRW